MGDDIERPEEVFGVQAVESIPWVEISGAAGILGQCYCGEVEAGRNAIAAGVFERRKELRNRVKIEIRTAGKLGDD